MLVQLFFSFFILPLGRNGLCVSREAMFTTCVKYTGQSDRNHQVGKAAEVTCDKSSLLGLNEEHFNVVSQRA